MTLVPNSSFSWSLSNPGRLGLRRGRATAALALAILSGTALSVTAQLQFTSLHSFNRADGFGPMAGVTEGQDGALYGTTSQGGALNFGTVFRLDSASASFNTLHSFAGGDGSLLYSGLCAGSDGFLYGSTYAGGPADLGTLFRVGTDGQNFTSLYQFSGGDGAKPDDLNLTQGLAPDGGYYGSTSEGGTGGGTLFRFNAADSTLNTLSSFPGSAGVDAGLVRGKDGVWFGTTYSGGAAGMGSVFQVDLATGTITTLHDFTGADGMYPVPGALIQGSDYLLYGTTQSGGYGTVYQLDPATMAFKTIHAFSGVNDGRTPLSGLTEGGDGYLYGTTAFGGGGYGTIYRIQMTTLAYNLVVWFNGSNGRQPSGNLFLASDRALYGTTRVGGAFNCGTVFRLALYDTTPPVITSLSATPNVLKPANGKMIPVTLSVTASDNQDPAPTSRITSVSCNQPTDSDWIVTGDLTLSLRAKTSTKSTRVYSITVACSDASGNVSSAVVNVSVPK